MANISEKNTAVLGLNTNLTTSNAWFAHFPIEDVLGKQFNNLDLHLVRFSLPQMQMGSTTVSFRGYQKEIPTKVMNAETKELTLEYIVDSNWQNYKSLYWWMSGIYGTLNPTVDLTGQTTINPSDYISLRIYLLDNYKKKIIQFHFKNCWIKTFNDLALETGTSEHVTHSVVIVYDDYTIENV